MAAGATFPPLVVFQEGDRFWLAEGFHRHAAGLQADLAELPCEVREGGLRDAILHSAGANANHGVRRSNADKHRAVLMLLQDEEWSQWSDREIGRQCVVDGKTVTRLRDELGQQHLRKSADAARTVSRGGKVYSMETGRIGRQQTEPDAPAPDSAPEPDAPDQQPSNAIQLGGRLNVIPPPGAIERRLVTQEAELSRYPCGMLAD